MVKTVGATAGLSAWSANGVTKKRAMMPALIDCFERFMMNVR